MIDIYLRCFNRARWLTFGVNRNLIDAQGRPMPNVGIDEVGNVVLTPAVLNSDLTVQTPAVLDTWWCVNVRLFGQRYLDDVDTTVYPGETGNFRFIRSRIVRFVRENGTQISLPFREQTIRAYQFGATDQRVQVLDPRDMTNPVRVWMGGQFL